MSEDEQMPKVNFGEGQCGSGKGIPESLLSALWGHRTRSSEGFKKHTQGARDHGSTE